MRTYLFFFIPRNAYSVDLCKHFCVEIVISYFSALAPVRMNHFEIPRLWPVIVRAWACLAVGLAPVALLSSSSLTIAVYCVVSIAVDAIISPRLVYSFGCGHFSFSSSSYSSSFAVSNKFVTKLPLDYSAILSSGKSVSWWIRWACCSNRLVTTGFLWMIGMGKVTVLKVLYPL